MSNEPRIRELLEDLMESGRSVEQVCAADPDLIPFVRERWLRMQNLQAEVDALFPSQNGVAEQATVTAGLPQIPGYEIERELGRGGMGVVYRARHLGLQRWVALKMMLTGPFASPQEQKRFQREAELVAQLRHPGIVPTFDVGDIGGMPFYTMELVEGPSLRQRLAHEPMSVMAAASLVATLAHAIEAVHLQGIVHRDLKPANILLAADGTPKISDFGLARRVGGEGLTISGAQVGTPNYMAPEQAAGNVSTIGPAVDIYSLGAILYELLAGRPPQKETITRVNAERPISTGDPERSRPWNRRIPRDIETICLCCLRPEPHRRYASAALLAADLERFVRGEPIVARRIGIGERIWKWAKRRPGLATAFTTSGILGVAALGLLLWLLADNRTRIRETEYDLQQAVTFALASDWTAARTTLAKAEVRLGDLRPVELQARLAKMHHELDVADRLDAIRIRRAITLQDGKLVREDRDGCDTDYAASFTALVPEFASLDAATVAATIRTMSIRNAVVAALDDWALQVVGDRADERRRHVLQIAQLVDPDPIGWRERARDAETWTDRNRLHELAATADVTQQPAQLLMTVGARLLAAGGSPYALLDRVLEQHPQDFFVNYSVGVILTQDRPAEALRYMQAAVALRPNSSMAYGHLGMVMGMTKRLDEGETALRHAIALDDRMVAPRVNLGICLYHAGRYPEAGDVLRTALALAPNSVSVRLALAGVLVDENDAAAALPLLQEAERLEPTNATVQCGIGHALQTTGRDAEAEQRFLRALAIDPDLVRAHERLANTLRHLRRQEEGIPHYRRAIELAPRDASLHAALAQSLTDLGQMEEAIAEEHAAIRLEPQNAKRHADLGVVLAIDWQFAAAVEAFAKAKQFDPANNQATIGMAQSLLLLGRYHECIDAARTIGETTPPGLAAAVDRLRREGERLQQLADRLPELTNTSGDGVPAMDRLRIAEYCVANGNYANGTRWYEWAFADDPRLAGDVRSGHRFAAIAAVQAGVGLDATVAATDRRGFLQRAAEWLREDLTVMDTHWHEAKPAVQRLLVRRTAQWLTEPGLARVRDAGSIFELAPEDRVTWMQLWHDIDTWLSRVNTR